MEREPGSLSMLLKWNGSLVKLYVCQHWPSSVENLEEGSSQTQRGFRNKPKTIHCSGWNSLDLIDRAAGVFHSHQQPSRVQYGVMMGALEGQQPRVAAVVRHIHIREENRFCVSNTPWRQKTRVMRSI